MGYQQTKTKIALLPVGANIGLLDYNLKIELFTADGHDVESFKSIFPILNTQLVPPKPFLSLSTCAGSSKAIFSIKFEGKLLLKSEVSTI